MAMPPRTPNLRFQATAPAMDEPESPMMEQMEGPSDNEAVHQAPKRKHRRSIELADIHKHYAKGRK